MPVYELDDEVAFPNPELADDSGLLAVGGDLRPERLVLAYSLGIFPWYNEGLPILWHAPDPRMVLAIDALHVPRSLKKTIRRGAFRVTLDAAFAEVIEACAQVPRQGQAGTWITDDMIEAYCRLHALGVAHSCEVWLGDELAGGLYGVSLGAAFFGESMFARAADASKVGFVTLVRQLERWQFTLVDCQTYTHHLARFGAELWPRRRFMAALREALARPTRRGPWRFDQPVAEVA